MSTFYARMAAAKRAKQEARNRGESSGNYGMRPLTQAERDEVENRPAPVDWLEFAFMRIALGLAHDRAEEKARLDWLLLENQDPTIADYAAAYAIPF